MAASPNFLQHVSSVSAFCPALCPLWPRLQTLSAMCPPCLLSAMCRPCVRRVSALPAAPKLVRHVRLASALCSPCVRPGVRLESALAAPQTLSAMCWPCVALSLLLAASPNFVRHVTALPFVHHVSAKAGLASGFCRLTACCGIISRNSYAPLRNPQRFICLLASPILDRQVRAFASDPMLAKLFGVYAGIIPQTIYCGVLSQEKKGWPRYALAASWSLSVSAACQPCWLWPRLHSLSAASPPSVRSLCCLLWTRLQSLSAACPPCVRTCPPCVRLVLLALVAPPVLVRHLSATCPPCVALAAPPLLVRHLFATCPPLVRLVSNVLLALAAPPGLVRHLSVLCPPLVRLLCWLWPRLQSSSVLVPPCLRHVSAVCPALAPPPVLVGHLSAKVFAFNVRLYSVWICVPLCPPLSGSICM